MLIFTARLKIRPTHKQSIFPSTPRLTLQQMAKALRGLAMALIATNSAMNLEYSLRWMGVIRHNNTCSSFSGSVWARTVWPRLSNTSKTKFIILSLYFFIYTYSFLMVKTLQR